MTARRDYGPVQLATYLGLERWQFSRAREAGLIPGPDRPRGRWSAEVASALARRGQIRIDWTAVCAVQAGRRSPLAALPTTAASSR